MRSNFNSDIAQQRSIGTETLHPSSAAHRQPSASMTEQQSSHGHYSGHNPIPNIQKFVESLDRDKAQRDKEIDDEHWRQQPPGASDVYPHEPHKAGTAGTQKTVRDPTTHKDVVIENVNKDTMKNVRAPHLSVPNANVGKSSSVKTDSSQSGQEYKENQDITAPPDPVAPDSTSDVPIHGEKTNILFHPTPSVSYEPAFASMEKRAGILCVGVLVAIVFLGKLFGGSLIGLIPTAMCVASGIWLWSKDVVRSGREVEWDSEKKRGETVCALCRQPDNRI